MSAKGELPAWVDIALLPLVNLALAFALSGLVVIAVGENPVAALTILVRGAIGYPEAIAFTLYYATNFIFTGLAVAVAFHAGLFNIGGEGQAYIAGLGVALVCLFLDFLPWPLIFLLAMAASMGFGAIWGAVPGWLQARRGSHVVITTIMFNFIAAALMTYLLAHVMLDPGHGAPETRRFISNATLPSMQTMLGWIGIDAPRSPLNLAFVLALIAAALVYVYVWRTRWGYALRVVGQNEQAARYAGIDPGRVMVVAMAISGALAGMMALNEIMGAHQRLLSAFTSGFGFVGIAVALMGRNHPVGVCLSA
ncbi:MAG: ABC transporter permease, partial [Tagaea sp.]|nr:ABC transporter permease [Tagaea sp.]